MKKDIGYIDIALNPETKKKYWLFVKCDELDLALTEWANTKPSI